MAAPLRVSLSTSSVYPGTTASGFEAASRLGYDGVEVMVGIDEVSTDAEACLALSQFHEVPVVSVHAPTLLLTQRVWGTDPWGKLQRSAEMAHTVGASVVVVHPPFRWQRRYVRGFAETVAELEERSDVAVAVENMFPVRADRVFGKYTEAAERMARRGGPGTSVSAFGTSIDPTDDGFAHYTLDLSHTATAGHDAIAMFERMGSSLNHLHLTDGIGAAVDEHLVPGDGNQPCVEICRRLADSDFDGAVVLEVSTGSARTKPERSEILARSLAFAREHLARDVTPVRGDRP